MRIALNVLTPLLLAIALLLPAAAASAQPAGDRPAAAPAAQADAPPTPQARPDAAALAIDLSTPRATLLRTYFPAINRINRGEGDVDAAWAHVLATMRWQDMMSEAEARVAAMHLLEVFDKLGEITDAQVPGPAELREADVQRFVLFPQPEHHTWAWDELRAFNRWPEGQVVLVLGDDGWQFSAGTVAGIVRLAESMEPLPPRHLAPQLDAPTDELLGLLGPTFELTPWWGWLALAGLIFVGLLAGKILGGGGRRTGAPRPAERGNGCASAAGRCARSLSTTPPAPRA